MRGSLSLALLLLAEIWGGSYFFIKVLVEHFGPWTVVFLRSVLGLAAVASFMIVARKPFGWKRLPWGRVAIMAFINTCIPWALIGFSETRIASGMASALNATTPLWSLVVGIVFFGAAARRSQWLGMVAAVVGLAVLLEMNPATILSVDFLGFAGMMLASLCYGAGSQLSGRLLSTLTVYQTTFGTLLFSSIGSGLAAFLFEPIPFAKLADPLHAFAVLGLGVFGSGFAYIVFYRLVQAGGPEFATLVTYLLPVFSLAWGGLLLNETIRWSMAAGLALILSGVFLASKSSISKPRPTKSANADVHVHPLDSSEA
ncbi:DMT family transporter [Paenibacillus antri]|uniref:DMT family transporter n=1 Tax=Paenibacillus antri TaxID=2582848 RepID=A0A5R9G9C6_9BACL|nr:DMT family transporter [Paenibacillus antri]TLS52341.1 DMT family transporter [Paenibacillus antri]